MAKAKEAKISQSIKVIGLVTKGESKTITTKKGDKEVLELSVRTPEGCLVKISNFVRESDSDYVNQKTEELRAMIIEANNKQKVYISKNIYMNKEGIQYDWFSSQETDDEKVFHQMDGFVDRLTHSELEDGDYITYEAFGQQYVEKFEDIENSIAITMYAYDKTESKVYFTNEAEYEKEVVVDVKDTTDVELGTAYSLKLKFVKGDMVQTSAKDVKLDWGAEEATYNTTFMPDKLIPISVVKTKLVSERIDGGSADDGGLNF